MPVVEKTKGVTPPADEKTRGLPTPPTSLPGTDVPPPLESDTPPVGKDGPLKGKALPALGSDEGPLDTPPTVPPLPEGKTGPGKTGISSTPPSRVKVIPDRSSTPAVPGTDRSTLPAPPVGSEPAPLKIGKKDQPGAGPKKEGMVDEKKAATVKIAGPVKSTEPPVSGVPATPVPVQPETFPPDLAGKPLPPIGAHEPPTVPIIKHPKPDEPAPKPPAPTVRESRTLPPPSVREDRTSSGKPIERSSFTPSTGTPSTGSVAPPESTPSGGARLGAPRVSVRIVDEGITPVAAKEPLTPPTKLDTASLRPVESEAPASFRVETVSARLGDTWESLSTRYYGNDRCGVALQAFNRDYAFSSERMRREGAFSAGERVFIPPASVLVGRYKWLIRAPSSSAPVPPATETRSRGF
jgi:hypothetical protein